MEVLLPPTMTVTVGAIVAFLTIFSSIIGVYYRLSGQVRHLESKFDAMTERNKRADEETEAVKNEQAHQRTVVAVMAEKVNGIDHKLDRIDRNIERLAAAGDSR